MSKLKTLFHFLWSDFPRYRITFFINCYNLICLLWYCVFYNSLEPHTEALGYVVLLFWVLCFNLFVYIFFFILLYKEKTNKPFFIQNNSLFRIAIIILLFALPQYAIYLFLISIWQPIAVLYLLFFLLFLSCIEIKNIFGTIITIISKIIFLVSFMLIYFWDYMDFSSFIYYILFFIFFFIEYKKQFFVKKDNPVFKNKLYKAISIVSIFAAMLFSLSFFILLCVCSVAAFLS